MPRVLISPSAVQGDSITIADPRELHHLVDVLRVKAGDQLECFDGEGRTYVGPVRQASRTRLVVRIAQEREEPGGALALTLALSLIRPERFEWVVQKATELGVRRLVPLVTARTVIRLSADRVAGKLARWHRIAAEAATQCGQPSLPTIEPPQRFDRFLATLGRESRLLIPTLAVRCPSLATVLKAVRRPRAAVALIGPEGDFTADEVALAQRCGARPVSLGPLTLRSETAAIVMVAILQHRWGSL
jgi:16S rRNA (uracil1498-N3)-methyltransferase